MGKKSHRAVHMSVECFKLYARDDEGNFTVREDGASDETVFYTIGAVKGYVRNIPELNDKRISMYVDRIVPGVIWVVATDRVGAPKQATTVRKAVWSRRYLGAEDVLRLLERKHEHQDLFEQTMEIRDAEEWSCKKSRRA